MKYIIRDTEAGNCIDEFDTLEQARHALNEYEEDDMQLGQYECDFYEIIESNQ